MISVLNDNNPNGSSHQNNASEKEANGGRLAKLSLAALGVVFGDIGTSPIYALRECFHGEYGISVTSANILGVLSLMFWALVMIVSFKYLTFVLRADNNGEGGVIALTALLKRTIIKKNNVIGLVVLGLFAACLLYGDGMITPAISVLSAVEGIRIITPVFKPYIVPLTIVILAGLFFYKSEAQQRWEVFSARSFCYGLLLLPFWELFRLRVIRKCYLLFFRGME